MPVTLTIDVERETDGRWLAVAVVTAEAMALRVIADRLERSGDGRLVALTFTRAAS